MTASETRLQPTEAPPPAPPPVPSAGAVLLIGAFSFREMARRRRLISLAVLTLVPVLLLLAVRTWYPGPVSPEVLLAILAGDVFIPFLIPIIAMAVGVSAIGEPIEEGTLIYYWTRPLRRYALYLGRLMAAQLVAGSLLLISLVLCFLTLVLGGFGALSLGFVKLYLATGLVVLLGTGVYAAVFAWIGTSLRRPLLAAILFAFGWEPAVGGIPQRIQEWTLRFHLRNLIEWPEVQSQDLRGLIEDLLNRALQREPVPDWRSVLVLLAVAVVTTTLGVWMLKRRELDKQGG